MKRSQQSATLLDAASGKIGVWLWNTVSSITGAFGVVERLRI